VIEQPGGEALETLARSRMKPPGVRFDQRRISFEYAEDGVFIVPVKRLHQLIASSGLRIGLRLNLAAVFFFLNDRDDFVVTAIPRDDQSGGCCAVRPDAFARVGSALHQQADHFRQASVHAVMENLVFVFVRHIGAYKAGLRIEDLAHTIAVVGLYSFGKLVDGEGFGRCHRAYLRISQTKARRTGRLVFCQRPSCGYSMPIDGFNPRFRNPRADPL
jgi:hypothetical protein